MDCVRHQLCQPVEIVDLLQSMDNAAHKVIQTKEVFAQRRFYQPVEFAIALQSMDYAVTQVIPIKMDCVFWHQSHQLVQEPIQAPPVFIQMDALVPTVRLTLLLDAISFLQPVEIVDQHQSMDNAAHQVTQTKEVFARHRLLRQPAQEPIQAPPVLIQTDVPVPTEQLIQPLVATSFLIPLHPLQTLFLM